MMQKKLLLAMNKANIEYIQSDRLFAKMIYPYLRMNLSQVQELITLNIKENYISASELKSTLDGFFPIENSISPDEFIQGIKDIAKDKLTILANRYNGSSLSTVANNTNYTREGIRQIEINDTKRIATFIFAHFNVFQKMINNLDFNNLDDILIKNTTSFKASELGKIRDVIIYSINKNKMIFSDKFLNDVLNKKSDSISY